MMPLISESLDFIFYLKKKTQQFKALLEQYFEIKSCLGVPKE